MGLDWTGGLSKEGPDLSKEGLWLDRLEFAPELALAPPAPPRKGRKPSAGRDQAHAAGLAAPPG
eukprot:1151434-Prymnesium_polylepis.1